MTSDFITALQWIFHTGYYLLTCFYIPGTNVTPFAMIMFGASVFVVIKFLGMILTFNPGASDHSGKVKNDEK